MGPERFPFFDDVIYAIELHEPKNQKKFGCFFLQINNNLDLVLSCLVLSCHVNADFFWAQHHPCRRELFLQFSFFRRRVYNVNFCVFFHVFIVPDFLACLLFRCQNLLPLVRVPVGFHLVSGRPSHLGPASLLLFVSLTQNRVEPAGN